MSHPHDQLAAYVDGELEASEATAFDLHLATCRDCQDALHDAMQLAALEAEIRGEVAPPRAAVPVARASAPVLAIGDAASDGPAEARRAAATALGDAGARRGRRRWGPLFAIAAAAAIAVVIVAGQLRRGAPPPGAEVPVVLATAATRSIEGRISYAAADRHRRYDVVRSGEPARAADQIAFDTLSLLDHRGDFHGVAAASLLAGDTARATAYLDRAAPGPDVAADRALLQLAAGHPSDALIALDGVLAAAPRHPQALWNRALALRDLGCPLSAAEAFEAVATLGEQGWADEARDRALQLTTEIRDREAAFMQLAFRDGPRLAEAADAIAPDAARRLPGMTRLLFYDGVRSATSAAAVLALAPLARSLDAVYGGDALARYVAATARADFAVRAPLARRYAASVAGSLPEPDAHRLPAELRAAHADDILIGALFRAAVAGAAGAAELAELGRLADATGDPWLHLAAVERAVDALIARSEPAAAEALALPELAACATSRLDYRCASLALVLGAGYQQVLRLADAQRLAAATLPRAQRGGEWKLEERTLVQLAMLAVLGDDALGITLPVARAYTRELALREPARCELAAWGDEQVALLLVNRFDFAGARAELDRADAEQARCGGPGDEPPGIVRLFVAAHVLRGAAADAGEVARLRAQIDRARQSASPSMLAMLDHVEGRLQLDRDPTAATALLERSIAEAEAAGNADGNAPKARAYAFSLLALEAGRTSAWDRAWTVLARAARLPVPRRCALGVAAEDGATLVVARDAGGADLGAFRTGTGPALDAAHLVPAALVDALRGCPEVEVLARPPAQGLPALLPPELAWSYRLDREPGAAGAPLPNAAAAAPDRPRRLVIAGAEPPASLGIARLAPWSSADRPDVLLEGPAATPARALDELGDATFVEIHAHGTVDASAAGALVMLSPDPDGRYALTAEAIRQRPLRGRPIVILAACHAAATAPYRHEAWSLPAAFVTAGARAVIASTDVIDDASAGAVFDDVRARIAAGASPAVALRDARAAHLARHPDAAWLRSVMAFR